MDGVPDEDLIDANGRVILSLVSFLRTFRDRSIVERTFKEASRRLGRKITVDDIKEDSWYTHREFRVIVESAASVLDMDTATISAMAGRYVVEHMSLLKVFIRMLATPESLAYRAQDTWKKFHKIGRLEAVEVSAGRIVIRLCDYYHGPHVCPGFMSNTQELLSIKVGEVRAEETKCRSRGDAYCEFVFEWNGS